MSQSPNCPQPHRLCYPGLGASETGRSRNQADRLPGQTWSLVGLHAPAVEVTGNRHGSCVSPKTHSITQKGDRKMSTFVLEGKLSDEDAKAVAYLCNERFGKEVLITGDRVGLELWLDLDITQISTVAGMIFSMISLYITAKRAIKEDRKLKASSIKDVRQSIGDELSKFGIEDFHIVRAEGLQRFLQGSSGSCRVFVSTAQSDFVIVLSELGDVHVIEVA